MKISSISPSKLQMYADCPACFLLCMQGKQQQTSAAMRFGTKVHKAIELFHKYEKTEADEDVQPYLDAYMEEYDSEYTIAEEFWKVPLFDTGMLLSTKADLIKDNMLIDHKTSKRPYSQEFVDVQHQVTAYSYSWSQKYSQKEDRVRFNIFITDPKPGEELLQILDTQRTEQDILQWKEWVFEVLVGIENDQFEPRKARWHNYDGCPFYEERE